MYKYRVVENAGGDFFPQYRLMVFLWWSNFSESIGFETFVNVSFKSLDEANKFIEDSIALDAKWEKVKVERKIIKAHPYKKK